MQNKRKYEPEEYRKLFNEIHNGKFELLSDYTTIQNKVRVKHLDCGYEFETDPDKALKRKDIVCPKCDKRYTIAIPNVNDIYTTNPEIVYLLADKEDAHRYKANSKKKIVLVCPVCGKEHEMTINKVVSRGYSCPYCGKKSGSYGERFLMNMFYQLEQVVENEFTPKWIKPKRFDFMFEKDDKKYIIELDGGWHFSDNRLSGKTYEEQKKTDAEKQKRAEDMGFIVIRLDYNYVNNNRNDYLINSIKNSYLSVLFDLSKIDFSECIYNAVHCSAVKDVADIWINGVRSSQQIADKLGISVGTVKSYLKIATDCNMINLSYDDLKKENRVYFSNVSHRKPLHDDEILELWNSEIYNFSEIARIINSNHKSVKQALERMCNNGRIPYSFEELIRIKDTNNPTHVGKHPIKVLCNETGEVFTGYRSAKEKYGANLNSYFFTNGKKCSGHLPDGTPLTWTKVEY